ncbi:hypothetical protein JCM16303_006395 [Sporobolomyces ruberrimus]
MPELDTANPEQSSASLGSRNLLSTSERPPLNLRPLTLDQPGFIFIEEDHTCIQYSFKVAESSSDEREKVVELYDVFKEEVTVLVAGFLHSCTTLRELSPPTRLVSRSGFFLECSCIRAGKLGKVWEWTKDNKVVNIVDTKLRLELGIL